MGWKNIKKQAIINELDKMLPGERKNNNRSLLYKMLENICRVRMSKRRNKYRIKSGGSLKNRKNKIM